MKMDRLITGNDKQYQMIQGPGYELERKDPAQVFSIRNSIKTQSSHPSGFYSHGEGKVNNNTMQIVFIS
jgi:hypothetical protein